MRPDAPAAVSDEAGSQARTKGAGRRWLILAFLMALCFLNHFNRASITSAGDERIMKDFGISAERMGIIYSAFLVAYTIFMIPGGWLIDRKGPRIALTLMGFGTALFCVFTGAIGFGFFAAAQIWLALLVVRSLMGFFTVPLHPGAARASANWFSPPQQALANGLITGASILAYSAVHPIFGALVDRFNWPRAFVITGTVTALVAIAWFVFASDRPRERLSINSNHGSPAPPVEVNRSAIETSWLERLRRRNLVLLTISYAAVGYFQYVFFYWLHYYFDSVLKMEKAESRYFAGLPMLAMAVAMPIGGWLADRAVRWRGDFSARTLVPKFGMIASALFLVCGLVATDKGWIVAFFTASFGALGLCEATFWTVIVNLGGARGGTSAAIMNTAGNGIGLLGPAGTPWISARFGWEWGMGVGAIAALLGGLCWFGVRLREPTGEVRHPHQ